MIKFARKTAPKRWFVIEFGKLGFIGNLFKTSDLSVLIPFLLSFYRSKPVDWLLYDIIKTKMCSPEVDTKACDLEASKVKIQFNGTMFSHIGTHSSLNGKFWNKKGEKIDVNVIERLQEDKRTNMTNFSIFE